MKKLGYIILVIDIIIDFLIGYLYIPYFNAKSIIKDTILYETLYGSYEYINKKENTNIYNVSIDNEVYENSFEYDSKIEETIFMKDVGNDVYKVVETTVAGYKAYLGIVYDPSTVHLLSCHALNTVDNSGKETVTTMARKAGAILAINGGGFKEDSERGYDIPKGYIIKDGSILWDDGKTTKGNLIGLTSDNKLTLVSASAQEAIDMGITDALEFGPFLIVNGENVATDSYAGGYKKAGRTAIAQREDGIILFLTTNGYHNDGPTITQLASFFEEYGAVNAANLDGGASTQFVENGVLLNDAYNVFGSLVQGGRLVVNGFGVIPN